MDVIDVCCCVFPDGTVFWTDEVETGPKRVMDAWKSTLTEERRVELDGAGAMAGAVVVRMLRADYIAIGAHNDPITLAYMAQEQPR